MSKIINRTERYKMFPKEYPKIFKAILESLHNIIKGKREIMYSDIINYILREGFEGEEYNQLILWCNYKIRIGEIFVKNQ